MRGAPTPDWRSIYIAVVIAAIALMIALYWITATFNVPLEGS